MTLFKKELGGGDTALDVQSKGQWFDSLRQQLEKEKFDLVF